MTFQFLVMYRFEISGFVPKRLRSPREEQHWQAFMYGKFVGGCCRRPSSTAPEGALSLYVGGVYLPTEVKPPAGRFYEIKKRASARASTASALFYYLYIRFASVTSVCRCIPCYHSYSMIDLWLIQYVVVLIIIQPLYLYGLYDLYCFTRIFWVENWSL